MAIAVPICSQDTRQVSRPNYPPVGIQLKAELNPDEEQRLDTKRIQDAMDGCKPGEAVELIADDDKRSFVSGPLNLRRGVTLLIDKGVTLYASRDARQYDKTPGVCGTVTEQGHGCKALINGDGVEHAAVMGEGIIDGRGGAQILGQQMSWWDLAEKARNTNLNQNCPRIMELSRCNDFTLYQITLRNSPNFHVMYSQGDGFTAWGVKVFSPKNARNTDGIDPSSSRNVTITRCYVHTGDDQIAIKAGNNGPSRNMTISNNHFYAGHGVSIGSETNGGVRDIRIADLIIDGSDNGLRIKSNASRGGLVENVLYEEICIRHTKVPILIDTHYPSSDNDRDKLPQLRNVILRHLEIKDGGKLAFDGFDPSHRLNMTLDGVLAIGGAYEVTAQNADLKFGPGPVTFAVSGPDVHVDGKPSPNFQPASTYVCPNNIDPFPAESQQ